MVTNSTYPQLNEPLRQLYEKLEQSYLEALQLPSASKQNYGFFRRQAEQHALDVVPEVMLDRIWTRMDDLNTQAELVATSFVNRHGQELWGWPASALMAVDEIMVEVRAFFLLLLQIPIVRIRKAGEKMQAGGKLLRVPSEPSILPGQAAMRERWLEDCARRDAQSLETAMEAMSRLAIHGQEFLDSDEEEIILEKSSDDEEKAFGCYMCQGTFTSADELADHMGKCTEGQD